MAHTSKDFHPAAGHDWLLPFYDPLNRLLGAERQKRLLIEQAGLQPGTRVLDVGCGTGSVSILAKRLHPGIEIVGLDPDLKALSRARRRAEAAGVEVAFEHGYANELPFATRPRPVARVKGSRRSVVVSVEVGPGALRRIRLGLGQSPSQMARAVS